MDAPVKAMGLAHNLSLNGRKILGVEGVTNLENYDQERIVVQTSSGGLEIKGEELHIQQLNLDQGKVVVEGMINALVYTGLSVGRRGKGFWAKLIK